MAEIKGRRLTRPALFICDIQEKFRGQIWEYEKVIATTQKLLKAAEILNIPVYATTQNAARLGDTCSELTLPSSTKVINKTAFSMYIPPISSAFPTKTQGTETPSEIAIVGIESHICITQTTLDLLKAGHKVYIIADGVSSCNRQEVPIALDRLRKEGAVVTTSESWVYECMGDAGIPEFKAIAKLVKETSASTKNSVETLLSKI